jgi:hypothetical protein
MDAVASSNRPGKWSIALLLVILAAGIFLRVWPSAGFTGVGIDEHQYAVYVEKAAQYGLGNYGRVVDEFIATQVRQPQALVPAMRIGFIGPAALLTKIGHLDPLYALRLISAASAILLLIATAVIGYRFGGTRQMLVVTTLMAVAPLQVFLAQRSLVDGYFAALAVLSAWFFFESLQAPRARGWLIAYGFSFLLLVLTKENAAFVCAALLATWAGFAVVRRERPNFALLLVTIAAGAIGVIILASLLGGLSEWATFYRMYARKSAGIPYVVTFQDGAWYRYLIDFTVLSPGIVALVFGRVGKIDKESPADLFWALFLAFSFVAMSIVPYGMSLRFAAFWDEPLRWLAASQVVILATRFPTRWRTAVLVIALALLVLVDLAQYRRFFVKAEIYDPVSSHLLRASKLVK